MLILLSILALNILHIESFYFVLSEKTKCFTVEQPRDTPIVFSYELMDKADVTLSLYAGSLALSEHLLKAVKNLESIGHVDFTADSDGSYSICFDLAGDSPIRMQLQINYGYDSEYYEKISKEQNFDKINMEVHKLNDHMTMILNEADYQKHKEIHYHKQTEQMNSAALWWPMVQIGILVLVGVFQVSHLKNFFKNTKLV